MNYRHLLVTGGCGFIGSHFVEHILTRYPHCTVTCLDKMTYAAHPDTAAYLEGIAPSRYRLVRRDIASDDLTDLFVGDPPDAIVNFAAETHVDRSILDPSAFVRSNINGTQNLLNLARAHGDIRFVQVSTDEVYGSLGSTEDAFTELSPLSPNSPYAASKAAADLLVLASARTFGQNVSITRCTNNYGPFQFPEKLLPLVIANAIENQPIPIYGDGRQVRDWIYVGDHCRGVEAVLQNGKRGEVYNLSASEERPNLDLVKEVLRRLEKPESLLTYVGDRPAHDRRYGLDATRARTELAWSPEVSFDDGLDRTIDWYLKNETWWKKVRNKDYFNYYRANYANKFVGTEKGTHL